MVNVFEHWAERDAAPLLAALGIEGLTTLAVGVLVDTFVVRPVLVPAFLVLLERGRIISAHWSAIVASSASPETKTPTSGVGEDPNEDRQVNP